MHFSASATGGLWPHVPFDRLTRIKHEHRATVVRPLLLELDLKNGRLDQTHGPQLGSRRAVCCSSASKSPVW
jgi:hypothetical protein